MSQNSQENACARVSFLIKLQAEACNFKFCEFFKNTFFTEHIWATASALLQIDKILNTPLNDKKESCEGVL